MSYFDILETETSNFLSFWLKPITKIAAVKFNTYLLMDRI